MSIRYFCIIIFVSGIFLAILPTALFAQCGTLVNGGFEDSTLGSFPNVVSPQFTGGYWGDENASVVDSTQACLGVSPLSGNQMLEEWPTSGSVTETWQAVPVGPDFVGSVSVSAYVNACDGIEPHATISIRTFNSASGWPNFTSNNSVGFTLDSNSLTWEELTIECVPIPDDTQWILIDLQFNNSSLGGTPGFVDDVEMICDCIVANERKSWGSLKSIYRN